MGNYINSFAYYFTKNYGPATCRAAQALFFLGSHLRTAGLRVKGDSRHGFIEYCMHMLMGKAARD